VAQFGSSPKAVIKQRIDFKKPTRAQAAFATVFR
jgi:hypothetical protein